MTEEEIYKACNYIRTHKPQKNEFETIDVAIRTVTEGKCRACTTEELLNPDDTWLVPDNQKGKFVGVRGRFGAEGFDGKTIKLFKEAVLYALSIANNFKEKEETSNIVDDKLLLEKMKTELLNVVTGSDTHLNTDNKVEQYISKNDETNSIIK